MTDFCRGKFANISRNGLIESESGGEARISCAQGDFFRHPVEIGMVLQAKRVGASRAVLAADFKCRP